MWRTVPKLVAGVGIIGGGAAATAIATSEDPQKTWKICTIVPLRLLRDSFTAATIVFDYQYSFWGLDEGSNEWLKAKHEVHKRSARRLEELCFRNGGVYIKLGQHIGQLEYVVPVEYVQAMRTSMLKRCPVSSFEQVRNVFMKELGEPPEKIFAEFDPVPLASASLAQVHSARTHDGQKVAVKVQHTYLTDTAVADIVTVDLIVSSLHWCFPAFDYRWLVDEIRESAPKVEAQTCQGCISGMQPTNELNFLNEARNSEKCLDNFRRLSPHIADSIYAPKVHWNLSTSRLLTMEFMDALEITDVCSMQRAGILPHDVSNLVSQAFAEMIFKHGFVHCDPHTANLMVRPLPSKRWNFFGKRKPQLILLDHGLYKELDFATRTNYAALWKALVFADANAIKEYSLKLGAGEDMFALFAGVLTLRPWDKVIHRSVNHLALDDHDGDNSELQMYASQYFPQLSVLLRRLPRVILLMLKTNDCLRAVNNALLQGSSLETFLIIGRISSEAVLEAKGSFGGRTFLKKISMWLEHILLEAQILSMKIAVFLLGLRRFLL